MPATTSAVFDASALVRAVVGREESARQWLGRIESGELDGLVPDLAYVEVANALTVYMRAGHVTPAQAQRALGTIVSYPFEIEPSSELAAAAIAVALARGVTAYDACYIALAEAADAVLVTADRGQARAANVAEFLP